MSERQIDQKAEVTEKQPVDITIQNDNTPTAKSFDRNDSKVLMNLDQLNLQMDSSDEFCRYSLLNSPQNCPMNIDEAKLPRSLINKSILTPEYKNAEANMDLISKDIPIVDTLLKSQNISPIDQMSHQPSIYIHNMFQSPLQSQSPHIKPKKKKSQIQNSNSHTKSNTDIARVLEATSNLNSGKSSLNGPRQGHFSPQTRQSNSPIGQNNQNKYHPQQIMTVQINKRQSTNELENRGGQLIELTTLDNNRSFEQINRILQQQMQQSSQIGSDENKNMNAWILNDQQRTEFLQGQSFGPVKNDTVNTKQSSGQQINVISYNLPQIDGSVNSQNLHGLNQDTFSRMIDQNYNGVTNQFQGQMPMNQSKLNNGQNYIMNQSKQNLMVNETHMNPINIANNMGQDLKMEQSIQRPTIIISSSPSFQLSDTEKERIRALKDLYDHQNLKRIKLQTEEPIHVHNYGTTTIKHYSNNALNQSQEKNIERMRLNYQYYRSKGGSSFSSNFNARRAFLNDKYQMRQIHQRSFDQVIPSGKMPHDMRVRLPNIPGVTQKTINEACKSGDELQDKQGLRTTKSSLNKAQIGLLGEKQLSPIVVRPQNLNHFRNSSNIPVRKGQKIFLSPPSSEKNSQMKKSHMQSWNKQFASDLHATGQDMQKQARETFLSSDSKYHLKPKISQNNLKSSSENENITDQSNQLDSNTDDEMRQKLQHSIQQMLIGAFPQRNTLKQRLHNHYQTQRNRQYDSGPQSESLQSLAGIANKTTSQQIQQTTQQDEQSNSYLLAQSIRLKKLSVKHRKVISNLSNQGILRKPQHHRNKYNMVTQSASADLDSPEYNELNRLNDMIDKRYSQGSHMSYING